MQDRDAGLETDALPSRNLVEFLGWVASRPRSYAEAMEAWRTSCPRISVWEDATGDELVRVEAAGASCQGEAVVQLSERGATLLRRATSVSTGSASAVRGDLP